MPVNEAEFLYVTFEFKICKFFSRHVSGPLPIPMDIWNDHDGLMTREFIIVAKVMDISACDCISL